MKKDRKITVLGWIFLLLGITSVIWHVFFGRWQYVFWFCNHAMIIAGLAVLARNRFWLTAMLSWALIPVTLWAIDFLGKLLFDVYVFRFTEYMFVDPWWAHLLSLQHLFTVPLMLYALWLIGKPHKWAWVGTFVHGNLLWIISYFVITPDYNINCVYESCVPPIVPNIHGYPVLWIIVATVMFIVTNWILVWAFRKKSVFQKKQR